MSQFKFDDEWSRGEISEDFFEIAETTDEKRVFALVIYDIIDNKERIKFAKFLQGFGCRVQKSAFEAFLSPEKYDKLLSEIPKYIKKEDNVRIYRIIGKGQVTVWGSFLSEEPEPVIII